jgi:hypothetical protein
MARFEPTMRTLHVTRYITPLREGGSMPAVVEADDDGMYVLKFRGAGQGPKALIAELVAGELARTLGLPVPDIALAQLDIGLADTEPDPEIQELIRASGGINLAMDFLPGAFAFDPVAHPVDATLASKVVWFDALVSNLDRTRRNTNLLVWHRRLYLIDHGAALYFHHRDGPVEARSRDRFDRIAQHVLLPFASPRGLAQADAALSVLVTGDTLTNIVAQVPDSWLATGGGEGQDGTGLTRDDYVQYFVQRLAPPRGFAQEAIDAHARLP